MKQSTLAVVVGLAIAFGFAVGMLTSVIVGSERRERTVALRWDATEGSLVQAQAHVYLELGRQKKEVRLAVYLGRDRWRVYGPRTLGWAATMEEAVANWGTIEWRADGLHIGRGTNEFFLARHELRPPA